MPRINPFRLAVVCALALSTTMAFTALAAAKGLQADLRVVGSGGKVLAEKTVVSANLAVKTSPQATCFGKDNAGSGESAQLKGNTAMGLLASGARTTAALKPLLITDAFDFGLAVCGVGSSVAGGSSSWYLKINHKAQMVSGDAARIKAGDEVLWTLARTEAPDYTYPGELVLTAPASAAAGMEFTVRVWSYDEKGRKTPAEGAKVTGGSGPTGADGRTTVTLARPAKLAAKATGEIPSAKVAVCVGGKCPK
ncbi:MAG TPA: hypothetical protein VNR67_09660 [Solirubrobacterales bacterium]|nr:hypothetical protein [Solirubrobacterales bacterium]